VDAVCRDFETSPLPERDKAMFRYLARVNREPWTVQQEHVDAVKAAGWSEPAIYDAATVCATFNFFNRWIDATGVPDIPKGFYEARLEKFGDMGYTM
jgi:alkylhydroperoxidase family enzyme